jgi:hypothetical protein
VIGRGIISIAIRSRRGLELRQRFGCESVGIMDDYSEHTVILAFKLSHKSSNTRCFRNFILLPVVGSEYRQRVFSEKPFIYWPFFDGDPFLGSLGEDGSRSLSGG